MQEEYAEEGGFGEEEWRECRGKVKEGKKERKFYEADKEGEFRARIKVRGEKD